MLVFVVDVVVKIRSVIRLNTALHRLSGPEQAASFL